MSVSAKSKISGYNLISWRNFIDAISYVPKILFVEKRLPGIFYRTSFGALDKLGIEKVTIRSNGLRVTGYTYIFWEYFIIRGKKEYDIIGQDFTPGMTVIDVGANQGWFTVYAASKGARVFSFEPSKVNFGILKENIEQNNFSDRVTAYNSAVSGSSGTATMYQGVSESGRVLSTTGSIRDTDRGGADVRSAAVTTLSIDDIFETNEIEVCDLLKLDCEGSEYDILPTISLSTFSKIRNISFEYHNGRLDELKGWLARGGFEVVNIREFNEEVGLVKARNMSNLVRPVI